MTATIESTLPTYMDGNCRLILTPDADEYEFRTVRRGGLGASDMSTILGLNPWSDLHTLWMDKVHGVEQEVHDRMRLGQALEPFIRDKFARDTGIDVDLCGMLQSTEKPFMRYSPDGLTSDGGLFEAKSTAWWQAHHWDDGQTADHAEIQVQDGMFVTGATHAWVAALIDGNPERFEVRRVERDDEFIAAMVDAAETFWTEYIVGNVEPPLTFASLDWAKDRWTPTESNPVDIGVDGLALVKRLLAAKSAEKEAKRLAEDCEAQVRALVQDGSEVMVGDRKLGTFKSVTQRRLSNTLMKDAGLDPEDFKTESTYTRFYWAKGV